MIKKMRKKIIKWEKELKTYNNRTHHLMRVKAFVCACVLVSYRAFVECIAAQIQILKSAVRNSNRKAAKCLKAKYHLKNKSTS